MRWVLLILAMFFLPIKSAAYANTAQQPEAKFFPLTPKAYMRPLPRALYVNQVPRTIQRPVALVAQTAEIPPTVKNTLKHEDLSEEAARTLMSMYSQH